MKFALRAGLTFRFGERVFEITRLLTDGEVQLEDQVTRRATVLTESELIKKVWSGSWSLQTASRQISSTESDVKNVAPLLGLASLKDSWQQRIFYRMRYLKGLQAAHVSRGQRERVRQVIETVARAISDPHPPSTSAVMDWARRYQRSGMNPLSLLDGNKLRQSKSRLSSEVEHIVSETLRAEYLTRARHPLRHAHDCVQRELRRAVTAGAIPAAGANVSLSTLSRRVRNIDLYRRVAAREGDARARMVTRTVMNGAGAAYPLQRVEVDHTPLNWVVVDDETGLPLGRPWLTVAIDAYSGYLLGFYLSFYPPSVASVIGVLRNSVLPKDELGRELGLSHPWMSYGLADEWVLDNGLEFHAQALQRVMLELAVDVTYCRVRTPWLKPHVERFFGELNYLTLMRGRVHRSVANVVNMDPYRDAAIRFGDLIKGLTIFAAEVHALKINQRKLARPLDLFQEGLERCPPAVYPGSWDQLRLISGMSRELTVGPGGLELHGIPYGGAELLAWRKELGSRFKTLIKWDPDDMGELFVRHPRRHTEWISCPARWGDYARGLSWNQHLMIRKYARSELKAKGAYDDLLAARLRLHEHWIDASRPKDRKNSLRAARAVGLTSAGMLRDQCTHANPDASSAAAMVITPDVVAPSEAQIPEFESFEIGVGR